MRRPQSAFRLVAVMTSLFVVSLHASPAAALRAPAAPVASVVPAAAKSCTKWSNQFRPPKTIRVLRTSSTAAPRKVVGTVQVVDFYEYVAVVMAKEWPEHYPLETIKAGAVATKQFAWYYILFPRGQTKWVNGKKVCYDVVDSVVDQYYSPESHGFGMEKGPGPKIEVALRETWDISVRKIKYTTKVSRMFLTGYRAGVPGTPCGADATGFKLFHNSSKACGQDGLLWREILRIYLRPNLEIVAPGGHDVIGTRHGDAAAMTADQQDQLAAHVWTPGRTPPEPGHLAGLRISTTNLAGYRSEDMNGDGKDDLVWLKQIDDRTAQIRVALSDGVNYGPDETWWEGDTTVQLDGARLLVADYYGNGRADVAVLGRAGASESKLVVIKRVPYSSSAKFLQAPQPWWSGAQDFSMVRAAWPGDLSGDGRADLIIRQTPSSGGVRFKTAVTKSPLPGGDQKMTPLTTRFDDPSLVASKVKTVVGDGDRDGRDDVLMLIAGGRARVVRLQGKPLGGLSRQMSWTAPKSDPIPVLKTKVGAADVDYDGRMDLVLYTSAGSGTSIRPLKSRYAGMKLGAKLWTGPDWEDLRPY